ncbi:hypothetical protein HPP92_007372 [Vanilla planifolia]|uniref:2-(3-amino-3-carboxypropyl)histidine synthase subunit 2 n=1 Tax=Vanilla planifolia TaxID=51239 RepID=A0A835V7N3_VANPL|nr:hypothetical protein HPP92_007372 [Vanilla planifolia]
MDLETNYEIFRTADFIRSRQFTRVSLQFPDELLKESALVAKALKSELGRGVRLFVMADTTFGSCCVDEVGAAHVDAECVVHYGHACMSPTTTVPAFFVFGKASIDVNDFVQSLHQCLFTKNKPVLVLYGLEYAHALPEIKEKVAILSHSAGLNQMVLYADVVSSIIIPSGDKDIRDIHDGDITLNHGDKKDACMPSKCSKMDSEMRYGLGGLAWSVPTGHQLEDYLILWIGAEDSAFANILLTFNSCEIVRYDAKRRQLLNDFPQQRRILKRRYYLVEKAKDANIVGILVGTLGVDGYLRIINQMKELIEGAGKKSYTLVMGRPNSAKLANFPECDVFVYVSCAQTALLESKDFLAPVITPFEAMLAFSRGQQWTGQYIMEFYDLLDSATSESIKYTEEARFSFIKGGYMEDIQPHETEGKANEESLVVVKSTEKALNSCGQLADSILFKGTASSGAEFFAARSFQGLNLNHDTPTPASYIIGRKGRAAGYTGERAHAKDSSA